MDAGSFFFYLLVMAGVTYLIRAVPFVLFQKKITNGFFRSFLNYIPYTVLGAMTFPAILYSTGNMIAAACALAAAVIAALFRKGLLQVAVIACLVALLCDGATMLLAVFL